MQAIEAPEARAKGQKKAPDITLRFTEKADKDYACSRLEGNEYIIISIAPHPK